MDLKHTPLGKSYWAGTGIYQKEKDALWEELVPSSGEAPTIHGEMIRSIGRLFYDYCNNGNCNAVDCHMEEVYEDCMQCYGDGHEECYTCRGEGTEWVGEDEDGNDITEDCSDCGGEGSVTCDDCEGDGTYYDEVEGDKFVTDYYADMLEFLSQQLPDSSCIDDVEAFMTDPSVGYSTYTFDDKEMDVYNHMCDVVIHHVLTTENEPRDVKE